MTMDITTMLKEAPFDAEKKELLLKIYQTQSEEDFWRAFEEVTLDTFTYVAERFRASLRIDEEAFRSLNKEMTNQKEAVEKHMSEELSLVENEEPHLALQKESAIVERYTKELIALEEEHTRRLEELAQKG